MQNRVTERIRWGARHDPVSCPSPHRVTRPNYANGGPGDLNSSTTRTKWKKGPRSEGGNVQPVVQVTGRGKRPAIGVGQGREGAAERRKTPRDSDAGDTISEVGR